MFPVPGLKFSSGLWSGDDAQLLHHAQVVIDQPAFGDLAIVQPEYGDPGHTDSLAGRGNALHLVLMCTVEGGSGDNPIILSNHVFDGGVPIREGGCERGKPLLHDFHSRRDATPVEFDVLSQKFLGEIEPLLV